MLKMEQEISYIGKSVINDAEVVGFSAKMKSEDPSNVVFASWQIDKEAYKANRTVCRADQAAFEDAVYAQQDEMLGK